MKKKMFITLNDITSSASGGCLMSRRNYDALCLHFGKKNIYLISLLERKKNGYIRNNFDRLRLLLQGLTDDAISQVLRLAPDCDTIFIDTSLYGKLSSQLRKRGFKGTIISFFHNVEYDFFRSENFIQKYIPLIFLYPIYRTEQLTCKHSDILIALNTRDATSIKKKYKTKVDFIIPVSLKDNFKHTPSQSNSVEVGQRPVSLFVGSFFFGNTLGLTWFIDEVLPSVDMKLIIIGKGMSALQSDRLKNNPKIEIHDYVEDTSRYMNNADFMLMPIFNGSGMKIKVCEALMYGKYIIGTKETFAGYDVDNAIATICNNKRDFVTAINKHQLSPYDKYNEKARQLYLSKYSEYTTALKFKEVFEDGIPNASKVGGGIQKTKRDKIRILFKRLNNKTNNI